MREDLGEPYFRLERIEKSPVYLFLSFLSGIYKNES